MIDADHFEGKAVVFYDGECGLCHRTVRFAAKRDPEGERFLFAPLQGETFRQSDYVGSAEPSLVSVIVRTADGTHLERSDAVLHILRETGGGWSAAARLLRPLPRPLRDSAYLLVARLRKRLFRQPSSHCPILPPPLRERFLP